MNEAQRIFCDGAAMAYRDCANQIRGMIERAPPEIKHLIECLKPIAEANENKAVRVYKECELFNGPRQ